MPIELDQTRQNMLSVNTESVESKLESIKYIHLCECWAIKYVRLTTK